MPNANKLTRAGVVLAASALVLTGCGSNGDDSGDSADAGDGAAAGGGTVTVYNSEPQFLMPGNSTEVGGSKVLEQLFVGLTQLDFETYEVVPAVAEDWESNDDATVWTFNLRDDWTFQNGEEITAQTFVDTFNWVVDPENAQQSASFMDNFLGYEDVIEGDADTMEGVRAVDDYTLEIELTEPFSPLPSMLTYTAFYPLPQEAFEDPEAFEQSPIGNGRYQMDGEWEHDVQIAADRWEEYPGEEAGLPERIEWKIYSEIDTAYLDVQAGNLDLLDTTPPNRLAQVEDDFGEHAQTFDTSAFTYLGLPLYQEDFEDVDVRHALSMAIDRDSIIQSIYDGGQTPAENVIPPMLPEARENICEWCEFNPEEAADLYEAAGGPSELTVWFNSGAGHEEWVEAVANQWQQNLPIDNVTFESLEFAQYLSLHDEEEITGPFRMGWTNSYPSAQYSLEPVYTTGVSSNYTSFSNDDFDRLIAEANAETDVDAATELYQEAEDVLLDEMPVLPMWFTNYTVVSSDRVDPSSVQMDQATFLRLENVVINE